MVTTVTYGGLHARAEAAVWAVHLGVGKHRQQWLAAQISDPGVAILSGYVYEGCGGGLRKGAGGELGVGKWLVCH